MSGASTTHTSSTFDSAEEQRRRDVNVHLHIAPQMLIRSLLIIALFLVFAGAVQRVASVLMQVMVAAFLAVAADTVVRSLQRRGLSRTHAVGAFMAGLVVVIAVMVLIIVQPVVDQGSKLSNNAPAYVRDIQQSRGFHQLDSRFHVSDKALHSVQKVATKLPTQLGSTVGTVVGGVFSGVTILFLIVFMLLGGGEIMRGTLRLFPRLAERRSWAVIQGAHHQIGHYFIGAALQGLVAGVSLAIVLLATGVPFALPLGLFMLLLDLVPLVGATVGAVPAIAVAFAAGGVVRGLIVLAFIFIYQQIENTVIQPRIQGRVAALPGVMIFLSVLIGGQLMGVVGALFAVPVAGVLAIVYRQYLETMGTAELDLPSDIGDR